MPIYTRTGDTGTTSLFGGKRVLKCEELIDVYGSIDELNSWIGVIASQLEVPDVQQFLRTIQGDLLTIGSVLAGWKGDLSTLKIRVDQMEARIDALEGELPKLNNFVIPGGSQLGALTHVTRSICRRVERQTVGLKVRKLPEIQGILEDDLNLIIKFLNRLSDLFFMLARFINKQEGSSEIVWSGTRDQTK